MTKLRQIAIKWKCSDGSEHPSEDIAKRHQEVIDCLVAFDRCKLELAHATVKTYKTKDGKFFDFGSSKGYFFIVNDWSGLPAKRKVEFWGWYNQKFYLQQDGRLDLIETVGVNQDKSFAVSELYADEEAANAEVMRLKKELMYKLQKEIV
jgi:hypothetical protein